MAGGIVPRLDFSPLGELPNDYRRAQLFQQQQEQLEARKQFLNNPQTLADLASGNYQAAAGRAFPADPELGLSLAQLAMKRELMSPEHITQTETARAKVAEQFAPKTTNLKLPGGEEVTVEKGSTGYRVPTVQGVPTSPTGNVPAGADPKKYREEVAKEAVKSAAEREKLIQEMPTAKKSYDTAVDNLDRMISEATKIRDNPSLWRATGAVGALPNVPGMAGADITANIGSLKSQVGFGVLQAMRDASKTGGALGNVSNAEGQRLEANLASLDQAQSPEQFRKSLNQIVEYAQGAKSRLGGAFQATYGGITPEASRRLPGSPNAVTTPRGAPPAGAIEALKGNPQLRDQFDAKYGPGAAARVLGQ